MIVSYVMKTTRAIKSDVIIFHLHWLIYILLTACATTPPQQGPLLTSNQYYERCVTRVGDDMDRWQREHPQDLHAQILQALTENDKQAFLKEFCQEKTMEYVQGVASTKIPTPQAYWGGGACISNWIGGTLFTSCD